MWQCGAQRGDTSCTCVTGGAFRSALGPRHGRRHDACGCERAAHSGGDAYCGYDAHDTCDDDRPSGWRTGCGDAAYGCVERRCSSRAGHAAG